MSAEDILSGDVPTNGLAAHTILTELSWDMALMARDMEQSTRDRSAPPATGPSSDRRNLHLDLLDIVASMGVLAREMQETVDILDAIVSEARETLAP